MKIRQEILSNEGADNLIIAGKQFDYSKRFFIYITQEPITRWAPDHGKAILIFLVVISA